MRAGSPAHSTGDGASLRGAPNAGSATIGAADETELDHRRASGLGDPGDLCIVDQLEIGMASDPVTVTMGFDDHNGAL